MDVHVILKPIVCHDVEHLGRYYILLCVIQGATFVLLYILQTGCFHVLFSYRMLSRSPTTFQMLDGIPSAQAGGGGKLQPYSRVLDSILNPVNHPSIEVPLQSNDSMHHHPFFSTKSTKKSTKRKEGIRKKKVHGLRTNDHSFYSINVLVDCRRVNTKLSNIILRVNGTT